MPIGLLGTEGGRKEREMKLEKERGERRMRTLRGIILVICSRNWVPGSLN